MADAGRGPMPHALMSLHERMFVGRDAELDALGAAWARAQTGDLQVVLLSGEPGIGKTTLAVQTAIDVFHSGTIVLFGRCDEQSLAPFQPFVEALGHHVETSPPARLRAQLDDRAADLALLLPQLGRVLPEVASVVPTGAETERYRVFDAVPAFLRAISEDAPVMLLLDDLHWADRPSLQLLQHVIRHGAESSLLIVGTYRDTDLVRTHPLAGTLADMRRSDRVTRIAMRGLSRDDVRLMVAGGRHIDAPEAALGDALYKETEGSPLFLREVLRHLAETQVLTRDDDGRWRALRRLDQIGMPEGVREVIGRRLTRLSDDANTALRVGSVTGATLRFDVLERVTGLTTEQLLDALDEATTAGVIAAVPGEVGRYSFTHALVRQALYGELSITRRVRLHQRVGEALEGIHVDGDAPLTELAFHFSQSAVGGTADKAVEYCRRAAAHARAALAYEEAARHLTAALEVADDAGFSASSRADLLLEMGDCLWLAKDQRSARAAFEQAIALVADDAERVAIAALGYSGAWVRALWAEIAATNERGVELLRRALALQPPGDSALRARLHACLAQELYYLVSIDERLRLRDEAITMARRVGDPHTIAYVLCATALATYAPETAHERAASGAEARALALEVGDERLAGHAAIHRFHARCQLDETMDAFSEADHLLARLEALKDPVIEALWPAYRGGIAALEGRFDDAERLHNEAFLAGQDAHDANAFVIYAGGISTLRWYQGRSADFGPAVISIGEEAYPALRGMIVAMGAAMTAEKGDFTTARVALDRFDIRDESFVQRNMFWLFGMYSLARGCWRLGDVERSAVIHDLLLPFGDHCAGVGSVGWGLVRPALGWTATTTGRYDEAQTHFERSIARLEQHRWIAQLTEVEYSYAAMLALRGGADDRDEALRLADQALQTATALGMNRVQADGSRLRARLRGEPEAPEATPLSPSLRDRTRARLTEGGRAAVARWTRGDSDEELVRRFGGHFAQRALFAGITRSYQPMAGNGFTGNIVFELLPPEDQFDPTAADWWTIEVSAHRATARRGRSTDAVTTVHVGLADFVRMGAGELHPVAMIVEGRVRIEGDVLLATRIPELFGAVDRIDVPGAPKR